LIVGSLVLVPLFIGGHGRTVTEHTLVMSAHHYPYPSCKHSYDCIIRQARRHCLHGSGRHCRIWHRAMAAAHAFFMANHTPYKPPDPPPAPAPAPSAPAPAPAASGYSSSDLANVPGVPYAFAACVAMRESTDGLGSNNIYGITSMWGYYDGMSIAGQKELFAKIYAEQGPAPWAPYDGC
jgi:hypothetical protein